MSVWAISLIWVLAGLVQFSWIALLNPDVAEFDVGELVFMLWISVIVWPFVAVAWVVRR